jgi:RimJ/RimL family protein N-acetyltransferase
VDETEILRGRFVDLRPLVPSDAEKTLTWRLGARARLLKSGSTDVGQQASWISSRPASEKNFIICLKDGRDVGMLSLVDIDRINRHAEPARFLLGDEIAVRGIPAAVEAMKLLYVYSFETLDLIRLHGKVAGGNDRMLKWQKYLGMRQEGCMRQHYYIDGTFRDAIVLGLLKDEYLAVSLPKMNALIAMASPTVAVQDMETDT